MTRKKANPEKRGRKPKAAEAKLEQLTVRLPPKLKFGLDLLARAQGRSLSQAMEWALQVGLNNFRVSNDHDSTASLMERAWAADSEFSRTWTIYTSAPTLLEFEDRVACDLVNGCDEYTQVYAELALDLPKPRGRVAVVESGHDESTLRSRLIAQRSEIFFSFVRSRWTEIRVLASKEAAMGQLPSGKALLVLLDLRKVGRHDAFSRMQALTELTEGKISDAQLTERMRILDKEFPWTKKQGPDFAGLLE